VSNSKGLDGSQPEEVAMPELTAEWGARVASEVELDLGRAFSEAQTVINTPEGRHALKR
jgi:hypothetical protein